MTECNQETFAFTAYFSRRVEASFTAGQVSSDGGSLLLRETDRKINLLGRLAACFSDGRRPLLVKHPLTEMLSQRIYGLALGYEDLNDHEQLRADPLLGLLSGKRELYEPLAGKSTLNRLELVGRSEPLSQDQLLCRGAGPSAGGPVHRVARHAAHPDRARSGRHRHPALRPSAGAVLPWLLRQLLLPAVVYLRRRPVAVCASAAVQPGCGRGFGCRSQAASYRNCASVGPM